MPYRIQKMSANGSTNDDMVSTKQRAMEIAQSHCQKNGDWAEIVRHARGDEVTVMRYWRDSEGLQLIEY